MRIQHPCFFLSSPTGAPRVPLLLLLFHHWHCPDLPSRRQSRIEGPVIPLYFYVIILYFQLASDFKKCRLNIISRNKDFFFSFFFFLKSNLMRKIYWYIRYMRNLSHNKQVKHNCEFMCCVGDDARDNYHFLGQLRLGLSLLFLTFSYLVI